MARLSLLALEGRDLPATFGIPWPQATALTVSFAPDGTDVDGAPSELHSLMAESGLGESAWRSAIFRALQQWSDGADMNFGVVADDGSPLGVAGMSQADPRFGDVRIFAVPLSSGVLAITAPPGDIGGTRAGDIILNSNFAFGSGGHDLYTVMLQEVGHAIGVGNSASTSSAMYEFYLGPRSGLSTADEASAIALYGSRPAVWEPTGGNETRLNASPLAAGGNLQTFGDLRTANDTDWYSFVATDTHAGVTLDVAGRSLLTGRVTAFDSNGVRVGPIASAPSAGKDVTLLLDSLRPGKKFYLRIDDAAGGFDAGQYALRVVADADVPVATTLAGAAPVDDAGSNDSTLSATTLQNRETDGGTAYRAFARLRAGDKDVYRVRTPFAGLNQSNVLTASVRSFDGDTLEVRVLGLLGLPVPSRLVADGNGLYAVIVDDALDGVDYFVEVSNGTADYELRVDFRSSVSSTHEVESGLLTILDPTQAGSITVTGSAQLHFRLSALLTPIIGPSVTVTVYDSSNRVKFRLLARAGDTVSGTALLNEGSYRVEVRANGQLLPAILAGYSLSMALLTDPVGVRPVDPNQPGEQPPPPEPPPAGYNYYNDRGYYVWGEKTPTGGGN